MVVSVLFLFKWPWKQSLRWILGSDYLLGKSSQEGVREQRPEIREMGSKGIHNITVVGSGLNVFRSS